jgi:hypothetical protein
VEQCLIKDSKVWNRQWQRGHLFEIFKIQPCLPPLFILHLPLGRGHQYVNVYNSYGHWKRPGNYDFLH